MSAILKTIESLDGLDAVFAESHEHPVLLFKHSNACGISADVLEQVSAIDADVNIVVVQEQRPLSNEIEVRTGHRHQSPQAFVLIDGLPVYHATHYAISPQDITEHLTK